VRSNIFETNCLNASMERRFFLIAGGLISSGREFILKLQEDWAYREEYKEAEERLERLSWVK
jgi:hypothetical protein